MEQNFLKIAIDPQNVTLDNFKIILYSFNIVEWIKFYHKFIQFEEVQTFWNDDVELWKSVYFNTIKFYFPNLRCDKTKILLINNQDISYWHNKCFDVFHRRNLTKYYLSFTCIKNNAFMKYCPIESIYFNVENNALEILHYDQQIGQYQKAKYVAEKKDISLSPSQRYFSSPIRYDRNIVNTKQVFQLSNFINNNEEKYHPFYQYQFNPTNSTTIFLDNEHKHISTVGKYSFQNFQQKHLRIWDWTEEKYVLQCQLPSQKENFDYKIENVYYNGKDIVYIILHHTSLLDDKTYYEFYIYENDMWQSKMKSVLPIFWNCYSNENYICVGKCLIQQNPIFQMYCSYSDEFYTFDLYDNINASYDQIVMDRFKMIVIPYANFEMENRKIMFYNMDGTKYVLDGFNGMLQVKLMEFKSNNENVLFHHFKYKTIQLFEFGSNNKRFEFVYNCVPLGKTVSDYIWKDVYSVTNDPYSFIVRNGKNDLSLISL